MPRNGLIQTRDNNCDINMIFDFHSTTNLLLFVDEVFNGHMESYI